MMQNWTKKLTTKNDDEKKFPKKWKDTIIGNVYLENLS